jgi:hypothetical protein
MTVMYHSERVGERERENKKYRETVPRGVSSFESLLDMLFAPTRREQHSPFIGTSTAMNIEKKGANNLGR